MHTDKTKYYQNIEQMDIYRAFFFFISHENKTDVVEKKAKFYYQIKGFMFSY